MRDVTSRELSCLLDYIYTGTADVAPSLVASFTKLAKDIGLKGFSVGAQSPDATSNRARLANRDLASSFTLSPMKQLSEPAAMPSHDAGLVTNSILFA